MEAEENAIGFAILVRQKPPFTYIETCTRSTWGMMEAKVNAVGFAMLERQKPPFIYRSVYSGYPERGDWSGLLGRLDVLTWRT